MVLGNGWVVMFEARVDTVVLRLQEGVVLIPLAFAEVCFLGLVLFQSATVKFLLKIMDMGAGAFRTFIVEVHLN